jgi:radical SAM superfamily enzyme YgiQ (UPF0313 family)
MDETFIDNTKIEQHINLFELMIKKGINKKLKWSCECRIDINDNSIFKLMKEAGCFLIFFGSESTDENILKRIGKYYTKDQIKNTILSAKNENILCVTSFIFGLPGETEDTILETIKIAKELDIYSTTFPLIVPFPGTQIRKMAKQKKYGYRILTDDWSLYDKQYPGVLDLEYMNIDELRRYQKIAYDTIPKKYT